MGIYDQIRNANIYESQPVTREMLETIIKKMNEDDLEYKKKEWQKLK